MQKAANLLDSCAAIQLFDALLAAKLTINDKELA